MSADGLEIATSVTLGEVWHSDFPLVSNKHETPIIADYRFTEVHVPLLIWKL